MLIEELFQGLVAVLTVVCHLSAAVVARARRMRASPSCSGQCSRPRAVQVGAADQQGVAVRPGQPRLVATETGRFGKRFAAVTVRTPDRRWCPIEIEAASRCRFAEWDFAVDEVLDAYFEDDGPETASGPGPSPRRSEVGQRREAARRRC
ncbi:hypothetical protein [Streptomyces griseoaurantiacus]|uniref:hypothetical protein n=1 Tax=Streptomyces griseoaurantiacus TaxID=68213 RepID=UPI0039B79038